VFSAFLPIFIAVRLTQLRPSPLLAYFAWRLYRWFKPARNWNALRSFFRLDTTPYWQRQRVVFESEPEAEGVMLAFHPHGMLCCGWTVCNASATFSRFTWLVADALLALPFISDFLRWNGSDSAGAPSLKRLLGKRRNVALLPGGFEEATLAAHGRHRIFLRNRRGFVKYALQFGYALSPVYVFGEERTYGTFRWLTGLRMRLCALKVPAVVFYGRPLVPFLPFRDIPLTVVVGKPLQLPRIEAPTAEDVARWHGAYCDALEALFERHKGKYAAEGAGARLEVF